MYFKKKQIRSFDIRVVESQKAQEAEVQTMHDEGSLLMWLEAWSEHQP